MTAAPQYVLASAFEQAWEGDLAAAAAPCTVPALSIQADGLRGRDLERFGQLCPQLATGRTVVAGHFQELEVPYQVNGMIERFLEVAAATAGQRARPSEDAPLLLFQQAAKGRGYGFT